MVFSTSLVPPLAYGFQDIVGKDGDALLHRGDIVGPILRFS